MHNNTDIDKEDSGREVPRDGAENHGRNKSPEFQFIKVSLTIASNLLNRLTFELHMYNMIFDKLSIQFS